MIHDYQHMGLIEPYLPSEDFLLFTWLYCKPPLTRFFEQGPVLEFWFLFAARGFARWPGPISWEEAFDSGDFRIHILESAWDLTTNQLDHKFRHGRHGPQRANLYTTYTCHQLEEKARDYDSFDWIDDRVSDNFSFLDINIGDPKQGVIDMFRWLLRSDFQLTPRSKL